MYPDISINELIKNGEKEQAAILVMDCLRQVINNGMPGVDLTRDEWLYVLPELVSQMQSAQPVNDPSASDEEEESESEESTEGETEETPEQEEETEPEAEEGTV